MNVRFSFVFGFVVLWMLSCPVFLGASSQISAKMEPRSSFVLQPGDRLQITVYREDDLSGVYEIDPSGLLTFPLVGEMRVAGLRVDELLERLNWNLKKFLIYPQVTITRAKSAAKSISVLGQVKKPGAFDYAPGLTVMRMISQAGGFERAANKKKIKLVRMVHGEKDALVVNGVAIINGEQEDPIVEPGDMIFVSESLF